MTAGERLFSGMSFTIGATDARRMLFEHFQVFEAILDAQPVYICVCRVCRHICGQVPRVPYDIGAGSVLEAMAHADACNAHRKAHETQAILNDLTAEAERLGLYPKK